MFIEVTHRSQAVDALQRGATLWCRETGEGWQLCCSALWTKRSIRRFISRHYADVRAETGENVVHFAYSFDGE